MQDAELARSYFTDAPNVEVVEIPIRDGWTRDWGPSVSGLGGEDSFWFRKVDAGSSALRSAFITAFSTGDPA